MRWPAIVEAIRADNMSGAAEIARQAAQATLAWVGQRPALPAPLSKAELSAFALALYRAQPAMAPLFNLANAILLAVEEAPTEEEVGRYVEQALRTFLTQTNALNERLAVAALELLPEGAQLLTYSSSSSIRAVLLAAHADHRLSRVFCTESRPMLEGQQLAQQLARAGIAVDFGVDAMLATFAQRANAALVGADSLTPQGVINKLGTTPLALICRHVGIPCYVVGDRLKWLPARAAAPDYGQLKPGAEVWDNSPAGVRVRNAYFECTPLALFTAIVGEDGRRTPTALLQELHRLPIAHALRRQEADSSG